MKFTELMTFWKLKDMIKNETVLYEDPIYNSDQFHSVCYCEVKDLSMVAKIVYKFNDGRHALVNADIMFLGHPLSTKSVDELFIKNAKVHQLADHLK